MVVRRPVDPDAAVEAGFASRAWAEQDADLESIRNDPRFEKILDQIDRE